MCGTVATGVSTLVSQSLSSSRTGVSARRGWGQAARARVSQSLLVPASPQGPPPSRVAARVSAPPIRRTRLYAHATPLSRSGMCKKAEWHVHRGLCNTVSSSPPRRAAARCAALRGCPSPASLALGRLMSGGGGLLWLSVAAVLACPRLPSPHCRCPTCQRPHSRCGPLQGPAGAPLGGRGGAEGRAPERRHLAQADGAKKCAGLGRREARRRQAGAASVTSRQTRRPDVQLRPAQRQTASES